jgi:hypothetical protein
VTAPGKAKEVHTMDAAEVAAAIGELKELAGA